MSGIDSSGKTTQIIKTVNYYSNRGKKVKVTWSRGGYTLLFNIFKKTLRKITYNMIPNPGESPDRDKIFNKKWLRTIWLYLALIDMILLYGIYYRILGRLGYVTIADRYIWDTYIDFKLKFINENFEEKLMWKILVKLSPTPYLSLILTIPVEESLLRSSLKNEPFSETINQRKKRLGLYQDLIKEGKWDYIIDGLRPIDEVWSNIRNKLK